MSHRRLVALGRLLVGLSLACLCILGGAATGRMEQWDALPLALLLHGAMATAVAAHGLTWRRGGATLQSVAQMLVVVLTMYWLYTWLTPLRELVAWGRVLWYGWLHG